MLRANVFREVIVSDIRMHQFEVSGN